MLIHTDSIFVLFVYGDFLTDSIPSNEHHHLEIFFSNQLIKIQVFNLEVVGVHPKTVLFTFLKIFLGNLLVQNPLPKIKALHKMVKS